jgi:hypothetical protein
MLVVFQIVFPLTPNPSSHKFGLSLISMENLFVRICGERGASSSRFALVYCSFSSGIGFKPVSHDDHGLEATATGF